MRRPAPNFGATQGSTRTACSSSIRQTVESLCMGDYVYMATTDCALVALDAASGKEVWTVPIDDYKTGCYSTLAPLAVRGKIILGYSGGAVGVRGSVSAFDALTGKRLWKTYTVPGPGDPGDE